MITFKTLLISLLLFRLFVNSLHAQPEFNHEISCTDVFDFDSSRFFYPLQQDTFYATVNSENTELFGPYFDKFPQIRSDILSALKYFPELAHIHLHISYKPIRQTMNSRPAPGNIFRKRENRKYTFIVNNNCGKHQGLNFEQLSYNVKIGWLGHELSHTCEYEAMNTWQTLLFAVKYVFSKKFVRNVERHTDLLTIQHGLAYPLYDGTDYLLKCTDISNRYRNYAVTNGLSLSEIKCLWSKYYMQEMLISREKPNPTKR